MKSYKRFTLEEILECKTNQEKLNELIENCQAMIYKIAKGFYLEDLYDMEDKMQIGVIGIFQAVKSYDPTREADFYTLCHTSIRNALKREATLLKREKRGGRGINFDYSTLGHEEHYKKVTNISLERLVEHSDNALSNERILKDETISNSSHDLYIHRNEEWDFLHKELNLSDKKLRIFTQYYLDNETLENIAKREGVTRQAISQAIRQIEDKIRQRYTKEQLMERLY